MTIRSRAGTDWYRAGERAMLIAELAEWVTPGTMPACIYLTGYTGRPDYVNRSTVMDRAASQVIPTTHSMLSIDGGGTATFANDAAIAAMGQAVGWSEAQGRPGPFLIVATSMGFMDSMAWVRTNQAKVAGVIGFTPGTHLSAAIAENRDGLAAAGNAAYPGGVYDPVVHGPTHDPFQYAAQIDVPVLIFTADDDTLTLAAEHDAYGAAMGSNCQVVHLGNSGGHAQPSVTAACARPELAAFIAAHTAA